MNERRTSGHLREEIVARSRVWRVVVMVVVVVSVVLVVNRNIVILNSSS
jgi:hypothetical protein